MVKPLSALNGELGKNGKNGKTQTGAEMVKMSKYAGKEIGRTGKTATLKSALKWQNR